MSTKPAPTLGIRHIALNVIHLKACQHFYQELLGMTIEWQPDEDNIYLTSGHDNLALHQSKESINGPQHLDHIGFIISSPTEVDNWYTFLQKNGVTMKTVARLHRDGAYSFYCQDPDGNTIQFIYHPP
ncbi:ring-cleaving dioxygenase [Beggiatoa sp. PS]|nr:ring-cleaving dioxygenase [Beggiatoa sp. PS]